MKHTYKILGDFGFIVEFELEGSAVNFKAFQINSTEMDGTPIDPELYMEGFTRWDGCMNFIHEQGVYGHFCETRHIVNHCFLFQYVYRKCAELLIAEDSSRSEYFYDWEMPA